MTLQEIVELRSDLERVKGRARLACAVSPLHWLAVHGVSLNTYLEKVDQLDANLAKLQHVLEVEQ